MRRFLALVIALALTGAAQAQAQAQDVQRIAAIVNSDVISVYDLATRIDLAITAGGLNDTQEVRRNMAPQVLRNLIDDKLKIQEAQRQGVPPTQSEVERAMETIANQNNIAPSQIDDFLAARNIKRSALESQIQGEIAWAKILNQRLRPSINVTEEEIDEKMAASENSDGETEFLVSEIALRVDGPSDEASVRTNAERIVTQLRSGADFAAVARQFSEGSTAADGGNLGWVRGGDLSPVFRSTLTGMQVDTVSDPIRTLDGFSIVQLRERRRIVEEADEGSVDLTQILLAVAPDAPDSEWAAQRERASEISRSVTSCDQFNQVIDDLESPLSGPLGKIAVKDLPSEFRTAIDGLDVGTPSQPIRTERGVHVLIVCERDQPDAVAEERAKIARQIEDERLEMLARRLLRDLRQAAFIDVRV
ncbi:MAG: hypothetical protein CMM50_00230 [Rhodospirillaceae bacterium]|nr:hypothetical protein [Rhodospirillaceae bacterium]